MTPPSRLVDAWGHEDPELLPCEKETTIRFAKDEDVATIHTDEAGIGRRLLAHPHSTIEEVTIMADGVRRRVSPEEVPPDPRVVSLRCKLPVGALLIKRDVRSSGKHSKIVTKTVLQEVET